MPKGKKRIFDNTVLFLDLNSEIEITSPTCTCTVCVIYIYSKQEAGLFGFYFYNPKLMHTTVATATLN